MSTHLSGELDESTDQPYRAWMWSPFASIRRTVSQILDLAARSAEALEGILGSIAALIDLANRFETRESAPRDPDDHNRLNVMEAKLEDLVLAVSEGVNNVQRSERRVRAVVRSARRELADAGFEHTGLEAENSELRDINGDDSEAERVPEVPASVAQPQHSIIPGVTVSQMRLARARRR